MKSLKKAVLKGKVVLVRVDFNVPLKDGKVMDDSRIQAALPTIRFLLRTAGKVVLCSHLGRPGGKVVKGLRMDPVAVVLERLVKRKVLKLDDCIGRKEAIENAAQKLVLLENLRFHEGEEANSRAFARQLAAQADVFVNDAFAVCHRRHASVVGVPKFLPSFPGFLLEREVRELSRLDNPVSPYVAVLGGAKVSSKIGAIRSLLKRADSVLVGGAMALTFIGSLGFDVGKSRVEKDKYDVARRLIKSRRIILPVDFVCDDKKVYDWDSLPGSGKALDIGPESSRIFSEIILKSNTVFWNGPVGVFEESPFQKGTRMIAKAVSSCKGFTVVGGGDTLSAIHKFRVVGFSHVSTGGGASLEFVEGKALPGIRALENV